MNRVIRRPASACLDGRQGTAACVERMRRRGESAGFARIAAMLRKDAKIELLKKVPLFSHCNKKQLASIASLADLINVPAGRELITEGKPGLEFMVIVEGAGEVRRKGRKIDTLGPGDFIGEMALISRGPRNATVRTTTDTLLLAVTERQFWTLIEQAPEIQTSLLKALGQRLQSLGV
jgi:CRP-like cAMP-binding protein